eukprot:3631667-Rhodomonas_salina.1
MNNIGNAHSNLGDDAKALEYHERALAIRIKALGDDHPDVGMSLNNIGLAHYGLGDYAKALEYHERALAITIKALGDDHPDVAK